MIYLVVPFLALRATDLQLLSVSRWEPQEDYSDTNILWITCNDHGMSMFLLLSILPALSTLRLHLLGSDSDLEAHLFARER